MLHDLYADCCVKVPNSGAISNMGRVRLGPESALPLIGLPPETPSSSRVHRFQTGCRFPVLVWRNYQVADQLDTIRKRYVVTCEILPALTLKYAVPFGDAIQRSITVWGTRNGALF
jgi:hypothetical protein